MRWVHRHALHEVSEPVAFSIGHAGGLGCFRTLNLAEQLAAFSTAVIDKCLHVLAQGLDGVGHVGIEGLSTHKALNEVIEGLKDFSVSCEDSGALTGIGVIFGLFGFHALVLQELAIEAGEVV